VGWSGQLLRPVDRLQLSGRRQRPSTPGSAIKPAASPASPSAAPPRGLILAIFAASGACALIYQVLWIRLLNLVFGATSFAMALVLAAFMSGLGLGSLVAGRWADGLARPIRAYALLELAIAGVGALIPSIMPWLDRLQSALLAPDASLPTVLAVQGVSCFLLLLIPTTAMGATLPILSAWIARNPRTQGRDLGALYAINTLGAFAGTVFTGFFAIEAFGIPTTNWLAVGLNVIIAAWALRLGAAPVEPKEPLAPGGAPADAGPLLAFAVAAGALGLAHEVVWTRLIGMVVWTTTYTYTTVLATVIGGIGLGSLLAARGTDASPDPVRRFGRLQLGIGVTAMGIFPVLAFVIERAPWALQAPGGSFAAGQAISVLLCMAVTAVPSLLMGATWPALARAAVRGRDDVGREVGRLYVSNTFGAVAGSFAAGFVLLPMLGSLSSVMLLAMGNLVLGAAAAFPGRGAPSRERTRYLVTVAAALLLIASTAGRVDIEDLYAAQLPPGSQILSVEEGVTSTVMVADHNVDPPVRRLWIQSAWVAGSGGGHVMIGHLGALHAANTTSALGIAFGTGQSFAAGLRHGFERLHCVDLNDAVVAAGATWFADYNDRLLEHDQVSVFIQDGRSFLSRTDERYDLIMMEPLQPWSAGAVNLYTKEFYELAALRLEPGGVVTQWMPIHDAPPDIIRSVIGTIAAVLPDTRVYLDYYDLVIVARAPGPPLQLEEWQRRISAPAVARDLAQIDYQDVGSVLSTLLLGPADLPAYVGDAPLLTDSRPFMEFVAPRTMYDNWYASNVEALAEHCEQPLVGFAEGAQSLPAALTNGALAREFARYMIAMEQKERPRALEHARAAFKLAPTLQRPRGYFRTTTYLVARDLERDGQVDAAADVYRRHLADDPDFLGVWLNLALLEVRRGNADEAQALLEQVEGKPGALSEQIQAALTTLRRQASARPPADPPAEQPAAPDQ